MQGTLTPNKRRGVLHQKPGIGLRNQGSDDTQGLEMPCAYWGYVKHMEVPSSQVEG